jgi:hypothetical protein
MTTVVSPASSPIVVYNRDGTTIDSLTSAGSTQGDAAPIVKYAGWTVVMVTSAGSGTGVIMPANADVGDLVEIHGDGEINLYPDSGSQIQGAGADNPITCEYGLFRKTGVSDWYSVGRFA